MPSADRTVLKKCHCRFVIGIIILMSSLSACGGLYVDKSNPTYMKFKKLCETEAGPRIYETVKNVEGYYHMSSNFGCGRCSKGVLDYGYKFIETKIGNQVPSHALKSSNVSKPGLYKYSLENAYHPKCEGFYRKFEALISSGSPLPKEYGAKCIATELISHISSQYKVEVIQKGKWVGRAPGEMVEITTVFSNIDGSKVYAKHSQYSYTPVSAGRRLPLGTYESLKCPIIGTSESRPPKVYEVFIPANQSSSENQK